MLSEYLLSDWDRDSRGGGSGGSGGDGCGAMILFFLGCLALSAMCNNDSKGNNYNLSSSNMQIEIVVESIECEITP